MPLTRIPRSRPRLQVCSASANLESLEVDVTINPLVQKVKPSKTMALTDLASSMRESGINVISLAAGEPDFDTPEPILEAGIQALREGYTRYTPNTGTSSLRQAICAKLKEDNGLEYAANQIVVSNGAKQSVWQAILATCSPGDEVVIPAPYWVSYPEMATMAGAVPVIVDTTDTSFVMDPNRLQQALTPRSRVLILCTPSNPSGVVYPRENLEAIAEIVAKHPKLLVVSDEIYEYITYAPAQHHSFAALPGMYNRTITINGFSKAYAMTGWRLGYAAAPVPFATAMARIQSQSTSGASSIAQHAALTALNLGPRGGDAVAEMVDAFQHRRDYICERLNAIDGVRLVEPQGAFYVLPDMSHFFGPGVSAPGFGAIPDADTLCMFLLEKAQVAMVPGEAFGAPNCIRISYAAGLSTLAKAMNQIEAALATIVRS